MRWVKCNNGSCDVLHCRVPCIKSLRVRNFEGLLNVSCGGAKLTIGFEFAVFCKAFEVISEGQA